jgi:hypothetical protein
MKEWEFEKENPEEYSKRQQARIKAFPLAQKKNKKMSVSAMAHWHNINDFSSILIQPKRDNG